MIEINPDLLPVVHHFGGGTYAKETHIPAGCVLVQHQHVYEHLSILASGVAEVDLALRQGPCVVVIPAKTYHRVRAITDCVWFCIHATEERDPARVDETLVLPVDKEQLQEVLER